MKRTIVAIACAIASSIAFADVTPAPGGPYQGTGIDAKTYLVNKTVDFSVARSLPYRFPYWVSFENVIANDKRLMILMDSRTKPGKNTGLEPVAIRELTTVQVPRITTGTIVIDGNDDAAWGPIPAVATDASGDSSSTANSTDLVSVKLARDDTDLYARIGLADTANTPDGSVMYVFELTQFLLQANTAGDILVNCARHGTPLPPNWSCLVHDRNGAFRHQYFATDGRIGVGPGFIEWKIPIADLQYAPFAPYAVAGKQDLGIDNRFINVYAHPQGSTPSDTMGTTPWGRPLIVRFYE